MEVIAKITAFIIVVALVAVAYFAGLRYGITSTTASAQQAATLAGAAKWATNKETGAPEFTWTQCTALGVTR